jgi:hypothetical protein
LKNLRKAFISIKQPLKTKGKHTCSLKNIEKTRKHKPQENINLNRKTKENQTKTDMCTEKL